MDTEYVTPESRADNGKPAFCATNVRHPTLRTPVEIERDEVRDNVVQFRVGDPAADRFRRMGDDPRPTLIKKLERAAFAGLISPVHARILAEHMLPLFRVDRWGTWRTPQALTHPGFAARAGCKIYTAKAALEQALKVFPWLRSWRTVKGNVYAIDPSKCDVECDALEVGASNAKKVSKKQAANKGREPTTVYVDRVEPTGGPRNPPSPPPTNRNHEATIARLLAWRSTLPVERIVQIGTALGLPGHLTLAVIDRLVAYYTAEPDRITHVRDLTAHLCGPIWLQRDAAKFVAKHGYVVGPQSKGSNDDDDLGDDDDDLDDDLDDDDYPAPPTHAEIFAETLAYLDRHNTTGRRTSTSTIRTRLK